MTPKLPEGQLLYAVGDIHGRPDLLSDLIRQIEADAADRAAAKTTVVFVGDYVDRGPDSRGVIDFLLHDLPEGFEYHFLKGNHEAMLLDFLADPNQLDLWLMNGGDATMTSYGVEIRELDNMDAAPKAWRDAFASRLPEAHRRFLESLGLQVAVGDYLFVHAGINPGVPIDAQKEADLLWIRGAFLESDERFGKVVVHGHTPVRAPDVRANRIGIDTGAVFSGQLTALRLQDGDLGFLQT